MTEDEQKPRALDAIQADMDDQYAQIAAAERKDCREFHITKLRGLFQEFIAAILRGVA